MSGENNSKHKIKLKTHQAFATNESVRAEWRKPLIHLWVTVTKTGMPELNAAFF